MLGYIPGMFAFRKTIKWLSPVLLLVAGCLTPSPLKPFTDRYVADLKALAAQKTLKPGEIIQLHELFRDKHSSFHLVIVEGAVPAQYHKKHAESVWIIDGEGMLSLAEEEQKVGPGYFAQIPEGMVHGFRSLGEKRCVALVVFSPPFDGEDQILVK